MTIPDAIKQPCLRSFHIHTVTPGWTYDGCGPNEKDRQLLVEYDKIVDEVNLLLPEYAHSTPPKNMNQFPSIDIKPSSWT